MPVLRVNGSTRGNRCLGMIREGYLRLKLGVFGRLLETKSRVLQSTPQAREVIENSGEFVVVFDVPEVSKEDINVSYKGGRVSLWLARESDAHHHRVSRRDGLEGEASLPADANVDPEAGTAILKENGSVVVELPKRTKNN